MQGIMSLTVLLAICLQGAGQVPPPGAMQAGITNGLTVERPRQDLPLQIAAATFGDALRVLFANLGSRKVTEVTLGILLNDPNSAAPVTRMGEPCKANVPPGGLLLVDGPHGGFAAVDAYFRNKGMNMREVSIGVTHVRFADGKEWSLPIETAGRFDREEDPELGERLKAIELNEKAGPLVLFSHLPRGTATCEVAR